MLQGTHVLDWEMAGRSASVIAHVFPLHGRHRAYQAAIDALPDDGRLTGARSVYLYFPSGAIVVSDTGNGLFVLSLDAQ